MAKSSQTGGSHVAIVVVLAVIVIAGALVYVFMNRQQVVTNTAAPTTVTQAKEQTKQVKNDLGAVDIDTELNTSDIDAALQ